MAARVAIMHNLQFYEHPAEPMADCLAVLANEFDHAQLGDELLREIAAKTFNAQDKKGPRLIDHLMGMNSYVRAKALQVLSKLCEFKVKFLKQHLQITMAAVSAFSDKYSTVRKGAASLLIKLVVTYP
ncbi:hypothetical protein DXG01_014962, partial [Tephrocybe rancida]